MTNEKYYLIRVCKRCDHNQVIPLTRRERAFELYDFEKIWNMPCEKCNSTECSSLASSNIEYDKELFLEWATTPGFQFMQQDEDLLIAEEKYLDILLDLLDNYEILPYKKMVLLEALCVMIYNETIRKNSDPSFLKKVIAQLRQRIHLFTPEVLCYIPNYIQEVVFPQIGLPVDK